MTFNSNPNPVQLCPAVPDRIAEFFNQIAVSDTVQIPEEKPDKEQIVNIATSVSMTDVQTVEVELPNDNMEVDGKKIFASGDVFLDVQYSSETEEQTVHFVRYQLPFQTIILTDCDNLIPADHPIFGPDDYVVHVCVEKLADNQIDERTITFELLLNVWVERVPAQL